MPGGSDPKNPLRWLRKKLRQLAANRRRLPRQITATKTILQSISDNPLYQKLLAVKIRNLGRPVLLVGRGVEVNLLGSELRREGVDVSCRACGDGEEFRLEGSDEERIVVCCDVPRTQAEWNAYKALKDGRPYVIGLYELFLPFTFVIDSLAALNYFMKDLATIAPYYLGEKRFGEIDKLQDIVGLSGKTVLELGPLDGYQTAGILHAGAKSVTCVDVRAVNLLKVFAACSAFDWRNVTLHIDDFHNVDAKKYGRFDLVCAHGVYYHSVAPFLLFENLLSLADDVFLGGFCATDQSPQGPFKTLAHGDFAYKVKEHREFSNILSGVDDVGYFFDRDDLVKFFETQGREVLIISDERSPVQAGRYVRLLIRRRGSDRAVVA